MSTQFIALEDVRVASPCQADWNKMDGDAQARFCGSCAKHVYNLSSMTRAEAEQLVTEKEGQLCVRFYQRADGTMLTSDCNVGVAAFSMKLRDARFSPLRLVAVAACAVAALLPASVRAQAADAMQRMPLISKIARCVAPQRTAGVPQIMGDIAPSATPMPTPQKPKATRQLMGKIVVPHAASTSKPPTVTPMMGIVAPPTKTTSHLPAGGKKPVGSAKHSGAKHANIKHVGLQKVGAKKAAAKKAALQKKKAAQRHAKAIAPQTSQPSSHKS